MHELKLAYDVDCTGTQAQYSNDFMLPRYSQVITALIVHEIFFMHAIGLNTSHDTAKTREYPRIYPIFTEYGK